nr:aldo/keto reductase [Cryobacterium sp.]
MRSGLQSTPERPHARVPVVTGTGRACLRGPGHPSVDTCTSASSAAPVCRCLLWRSAERRSPTSRSHPGGTRGQRKVGRSCKGYSETLIGEVMRSRREDCVLASKVWYELDHDGVIDSVHESLHRLQTDRIDLMQIHGRMYTPADVEHVLTGGPLDALIELREAGTIGHIGITTEEPWSVLPFLEHDAIEVYQVAYNIIYQAAANHFLIQAAEKNVGVVSMRTMTSGVFQREAAFLAPGWQSAHDLYEVALKFVLSDTRVTSGIVGMRWPEEVERNLALVEGWEPETDFARMPRLTFEVYRANDEQSER